MEKDYYSIILWKKAEREDISFDEVVDNAMPIFEYLDTLPETIKPRYTYVHKKAVPIILDRKTIETKMWNGCNKEDGKLIIDFGYSFSLFSSIISDGNCEISYKFRFGNTYNLIPNTIIIDFRFNQIKAILDINKSLICEMFESLIWLFKPYFGCIANRQPLNDSQKYIKSDGSKIPATLYGYNYWNEEMLEKIGLDRIKSLEGKYHLHFEEPGFIKLFDGFIDINNEEQLKERKEIEDYLLYNDKIISK
ncbi:MAG: hypothetical protein J6D29_06560 [Solobacterium sp.]|nr:hypothetical protein [Solobacterium sp.]